MKIEINQEDILNLSNARQRIMNTLTPNYEPLKVFTIDSVINQFVKKNTLQEL